LVLASSFYRFYPLRAEDRIADRHEGYFADDAAAIAAAPQMVEDFPRLDIWCGARQVASLAREDLVRRQPPQLTWAVALITRNKRLLHQAVQARHRTEALRVRAADLVSISAALGLLHSHGIAVRDGLRSGLQGRGPGLQLGSEGRQVDAGLLVEHAREAPGAGCHLAEPGGGLLAATRHRSLHATAAR
jgi:hypothetical protein